MKGADFIRQCVLQRVNVNKPCFGDNVSLQQQSKGRKFVAIWTNHCKTDEDQRWYKNINRPNPDDENYVTWERELRNFAYRKIDELINTHLPIYNQLPNIKKRTKPNQGKTVGALVDMIQRAQNKDKQRKLT